MRTGDQGLYPARCRPGCADAGGDFLDLLFTQMGGHRDAPITVRVAVADDGVVLTPDREVVDLVMQGNARIIGGHRLVLHLEQPDGSPSS